MSPALVNALGMVYTASVDRSVSSIYDFKNGCIFFVLTSGVAPGQELGGACEHAAHPLFQMPPQLL